MAHKTELCGFQPTGRSEDVPKPPKFNTDELSVEKLQEQLKTAKKALTESKELLRDMNRECDGLSEPEETLYNIISQALAAIGGNDE